MGAAIVALIVKKERDLVKDLQRTGALTPSTARSLNDLRVEEDRTFRRLRNRAVIREGEPGTFYLDAQVWEAYHEARHGRAVILLIIVFTIAIPLVIMGLLEKTPQ